MGFSLASFRRGLPLAAAAGLAVLPVQAQRTAPRGGQPILFSSPVTDSVDSNTPSLSPQPPELLEFRDAGDAPPQFNFNRLPSGPPLPAAPLPSLAEILRGQDLQDRKRNWAMLTPAEILGVATPEKILGTADRDTFGQPKNSTALERYIERRNQLLLLAKTNAPPADNASPDWIPSGDRRDDLSSVYGGRESREGAARSSLNPMPYDPFQPRQSERTSWSKLFDSTPTALAPGPDPAQVEEMERFRQLLNPGSPPPASTATPNLGGLKTSLPQSLLGSEPAQSQPNQIGASFTPLTSGIGRPAELPKLTAPWSLSYTSPPPAAAWAPQMAPWLSPTPQPFTAPQRRF
jgi:hypothetical protein